MCIHTHHGYKYYRTSPLHKKMVEPLISEIDYSVLHQNKNMSCLFSSLPVYLSNIMVSSTQTLTENQITEIYWPHLKKKKKKLK